MFIVKRWYAMASLFAITYGAANAQLSATLNRAEKLFEEEDYHNALPLFEEVIYKNHDLVNAYLKAGMCNLFLSKPEKGLEMIRAAQTPQNEVNPNYQFWLGRAYHLNMKIDSALRCYRKYLVVASQTDDFRKGVEELIGQIHRTEIHFVSGEHSPYDVRNLGEAVNSPYTEHSPVVSQDGDILVFTSRRPLFANETPEADGEYMSKLFFCARQKDGSWSKALPLHPRNSTKAQYNTVQWIENSEKLLLFTADNGGTLWETERDGNEFKDPRPYKSAVPARYFSPDGNFCPGMDKIIYANNTIFDGTYDLFMTEKRTEAKWAKPWKLSKLINSPDDEIAPVWLQDGKTIVFSSRGLNGLGGYDLFKTTYDNETRTFSEPENMGYPINTPGNDTHYFELDKGKQMFISSARAGGQGSTDIYLITPNDSFTRHEW